MARRPKHSQERPTKQQILDHIEGSTGRIGKREIARAFQLHGSDKVWLKAILKELESDGLLERQRGRKVTRAGRLPEVTVIRVDHIDEDGEVVAFPASWPDEDIPAPKIYLAPSKDRKLAPAVGDRVLARLQYTGDSVYEGRPIRVLGPAERSLLGVFERDEKGRGRLIPTDRRHRYPYSIALDHEGDAEPG